LNDANYKNSSMLAPKDHSSKVEALVSYLPRNSNGSMLITARNKKVRECLTYRMKPIKVLPLGLEDAQQLMQSKIVPNNEDWSKVESTELVKTFDSLLLAIT
jgi:hypothetical protein